MKNLFVETDAEELKTRLALLKPDSRHLWGRMSVAQALAHCCLGMQTGTGELRPPRVLIGRILGPIIKPKVVGDDSPMRPNSPTAKALLVHSEPDFATEQARLSGLIDQFVTAGPQGCSTHPHAFFGPLTPDEWAILMYKHIDHHLRQFGV